MGFSNLNKFNLFLVAIASVCVIASFLHSPDFFSRSGAVLVVVGFILISSKGLYSYSQTTEDAMIKKYSYARIMPGKSNDMYAKQINETKSTILEEKIGIFMTVLGTFIWAYGDKI